VLPQDQALVAAEEENPSREIQALGKTWNLSPRQSLAHLLKVGWLGMMILQQQPPVATGVRLRAVAVQLLTSRAKISMTSLGSKLTKMMALLSPATTTVHCGSQAERRARLQRRPLVGARLQLPL